MSAKPDLTQENIENVLRGITIPSPPQIIADLQMEMAMPDPDLNEMAAMISKDPGLAGGVLKTLNSPLYGNRDISSISKAVMMLGMTTIANIVNTLYLRDYQTQDETISDDISQAMIHFWDSATDVAFASQLVARRLRTCDPDMAYMLGLFHNVGIPLLMQRFTDYPQVLKQSYILEDKRIIDIENELYKTNHAVISFYTAKSWKLPAILCRVISIHHNVSEVFSSNDKTNPEEKTFLAILKVAEHLAGLSRTIGDNGKDEEWDKVSENILEYIGLSQFDYDDLVAYASEQGIGGQEYFM